MEALLALKMTSGVWQFANQQYAEPLGSVTWFCIRFCNSNLRGWTVDYLKTMVRIQTEKGSKQNCFEPFLTWISGPERDRTVDLYTASVALSQLSYGPGSCLLTNDTLKCPSMKHSYAISAVKRQSAALRR